MVLVINSGRKSPCHPTMSGSREPAVTVTRTAAPRSLLLPLFVIVPPLLPNTPSQAPDLPPVTPVPFSFLAFYVNENMQYK